MPTPHALDLEALLSHTHFVRTLARSLLADPNRADDVAQDTLAAALEHPPPGEAGLRSWLATVTRNFARQTSRRESRSQDREKRAARPEGVPSTAEVVEREATRRAIVEAVLALDEPYRAVLLLRYYDDLPPREIARRLSLPVETVRTRTRRGLERLRAGLDAEQPGGREAWAGILLPLAQPARFAAGRLVQVVRHTAIYGGSVVAAGLAVWWLRAAIADEPEPPTLRSLAAATATSPGPAQGGLLEPALEPAARESLPTQAPEAPAEPPAPGEVRFAILLPERTISGILIDEADRPVQGGLVYVGNQIRARGDEPFKPFRPERIEDGVTTDAAGQFVLTGRGRFVTAWHTDRGTASVPWDEAERIVLPSKSDLRGRLVDGSGRPLPARTILLDREREATTGEDGSFAFPAVDPGVRGLQIVEEPARRFPDGGGRKPKGPYFGVRHRAMTGEPVLLTLSGEAVEIALTAGDRPFGEPIQVLAIGLDGVFRMPVDYAQAKNGVLEIAGLRPGRQLLLAKSGHVALLELAEGTSKAIADLGGSDLTVRAPAKTRVYVVPSGCGEFIELMAGRAAPQTVPESGSIRIAPLPEGEYDIGIDRQGILGKVTVRGTGTVVVLE